MSEVKLLSDKKYQKLFDQYEQYEREKLEKECLRDLNGIHQNRMRNENFISQQISNVIEGIKNKIKRDGIPDGFTYSQTTWGFEPLKNSDLKEIISTYFDPSITISVSQSSSSECNYITVVLSESQTTRDIKANKVEVEKEVRRQKLLNELNYLDNKSN